MFLAYALVAASFSLFFGGSFPDAWPPPSQPCR